MFITPTVIFAFGAAINIFAIPIVTTLRVISYVFFGEIIDKFIGQTNEKLPAMLRAKIIDLLKTLTRDELKLFAEYLSSGFFNKRSSLSELLNIYAKYYPDFDDKRLTKEKVYSKLMPGKNYSDEIFRNLNSQLLKQAEDFLALINFRNDNFSSGKHLINELLRRKLYQQYEKNLEALSKNTEASGARDLDYFNKMHELCMQRDLYNSLLNNFVKEDIQKAEKNILIYFIMKMLEIQNYILYECRLLGLDRELYLEDDFTVNFMNGLPEEIREMPQVRIHYCAFMLEKTDEEEYFLELKSLVSKHGSLLEKEKLYNKYIDLIEYLKRSRSMQDIDTVRQIFELRKEVIEKGLYLEHFMTNMFFLNMVKSGSRLKEFEWVKNFIEKHNELLIEEHRSSTYRLALAILAFEMKQFRDSLSHLALVKYEDNFYNLEVRNLTSRIYYEMKETDLLYDYLNSYRIYVSKNRALGKREVDSHSHFISVLGKITRIKESGKRNKIDELLPSEKKRDFINRAWIVEKLKELEL